MYDICCIGHITLDKIVTPGSEVYMAGGTSFYFSNAIHRMNTKYILVTALAKEQWSFVDDLEKKGIKVHAQHSNKTVYFENIYPENLDFRTQKVLQKADPFTLQHIEGIEAKIFHLGPLLSDDISVELIKHLSKRSRVSLDVQGYLRKLQHGEVIHEDWADKREALQHIHILKANESEMEVLTGSQDVREGAQILHDWGVREVVITLGSKGSVIYAGDTFFFIPAYVPSITVDTTGCGDTYMAGYLYQRNQGADVQIAGEFAAAMASHKITSSGPFAGTEQDVRNVQHAGEKVWMA
jgi:sugar/nucleoside kinase (ribokinase family)